MADVARLAGVSHQTISRVLNGHENVRPETRARVLEAIDQLQYRPNASARALVTRRTRLLGVVAFDTTLYGPASTLYGIEQAAREAGYFVTIVSLKTITRDSVSDALGVLADHAVDGIVVIAPQREAVEALYRVPGGLAAVAVEGGEGTREVPVVSVGQEQGGRLATEHLLGLGHRTVHHVAGPDDWLEAEARVAGWRAALRDAGAPLPRMLRGDWSPRSGYAAGKALLDASDAQALTAVFAGNDQMALGVLRAFREAGVRVPDDVSVVGFDDVPEAEFFPPPLTTVAQDFDEVGRLSIDLLLHRLEGGRPASSPVVPPRLVVRESSGPPGRGSGGGVLPETGRG
ncbi:MAG: LacI family DNA-binding transcriptional regulator [Actinomycetes bacterium]